MRKVFFVFVVLLFLSPSLFAEESTEYMVVTVGEGENIDNIARKYLKNEKFKSELLRYNHLSSNQIKAGLKLKIPYGISKERVAKVKFFIGKVFRSLDASNWLSIRQIGSILLQKHLIKTEEKSKIEIQFDNGSLIQLLDNSVIALENYSHDKKDVSLNLTKGSVFANINKLRRANQFSISTVTALVGVRGTEFYVSIDESDKVKVEVYKGKVNVTAQNKLVVVTQGYETTVNKGDSPLKPSKIKSPRVIQWSK